MKIKELVAGTSLTLITASSFAVEVTFTEIDGLTMNHYNISTSVGNSGDIAIVDSSGNQYKWTRSTGLVELPVRSNDTISRTKISNDGQYILRAKSYQTADYYTPDGIVDPNIDGFRSVNMSENGLVIGGYIPSGYSRYPAFLKDGVVTGIPQLSGYEIFDLDASGDKMLAVKQGADSEPYALINGDGSWQRLTEDFGYAAGPTGISSDGTTIYSRHNDKAAGDCGHYRNVTWSFENGLQDIDCQMSWVVDSSEDGTKFIGRGFADGSWESYVWSPAKGIQNLRDILNAHGIDIYNWGHIMISDMSDDGNKLVGVGNDPDGVRKVFLIDITPICQGFY